MKLVAVIAASLLSAAAFAQTATVETETASAGLLGKRYLGVGFAWTDLNRSSVEGMGAALGVNVPVTANVDVSLSYGYAWLEGAQDLGHSGVASVTGYAVQGANKPFATLSLGYDWANSIVDSDHGFWGVDVGVQRSLTEKISATFSVGYDDDFGQHRAGLWSTTIGADYALTSKLVASAAVSYIEYGSIGYSAGLAYRF
jgi:hypothetical protein